jgi:hypothetical protein
VSTTPLFDITEWEQDQEQPHVTVNTAIRVCEIMAQLVIQSFDTSPPTSAADGDAYYIDGTGHGDWTGHSHELALRVGSAWHYVSPRTGMMAWSVPDGYAIRFEGDSPEMWVTL